MKDLDLNKMTASEATVARVLEADKLIEIIKLGLGCEIVVAQKNEADWGNFGSVSHAVELL